MARGRRYATRLCVILCWAVPGDGLLIHGERRAALGAVPSGGGAGTWSLHFVECERKPFGAIAASPCDMPAQLANESFRADHVRFGISMGAVVQVLMRGDIPATETFFRDHLRLSPTGSENFGGQLRSGVPRRCRLERERPREAAAVQTLRASTRNALLHALCSRPMRSIPVSPPAFGANPKTGVSVYLAIR
jgi:hypothetical protein